MELTKKTTILFPPALQERLAREARREAVRELASLSLPVADPATMKRESVRIEPSE
jgi:hypothetical protein